jgi:hypothetical protein
MILGLIVILLAVYVGLLMWLLNLPEPEFQTQCLGNCNQGRNCSCQ